MGKFVCLFMLLFGTSSVFAASAQDQYEEGVQAWMEFRGAQAKPCDFAFDSREVLVGRKTRSSVLILHGYTQNPSKMDEYVQYFMKYNVNVLVPRLANHFNQNLRDLDNASADAWMAQARESFAIAKQLGHSVIIVGYSLGGMLASRLALEFPEDTYALVLVAPAWRVSGQVASGSLLGSAFDISGNDHLGIEVKCALENGFISALGGLQVDNVAKKTEQKYRGSYPATDNSVFRKLDTPVLLALMSQDDVVDSILAREIFMPTDDGYRTLLTFPGGHPFPTKPGFPSTIGHVKSESRTPFKGATLFDQMTEFLNSKVGLRESKGED